MTENNNNKSQSVNYGTLSFMRKEIKLNNNTVYNYSIMKKSFDKEAKQFKIDGMITLNKFTDLSLIKYFFKQCIKQDVDCLPYRFKKIDNTGYYTCCKTYEVNGETKQQFLNLTFIELLSLFDLIDRVQAIYIKPSTSGERKNEKN